VSLGLLVRHALSRALDLVYPPRCVGCGAFGRWLCDGCLSAAHLLERPFHACRSEYAGERGLPVWSVGIHGGVLREAVHALKYEDARALAEPMATMMADRLRRSGVRGYVLSAVPLHPRRERERGYNQSRLLSRHVASCLGLGSADDLLTRLRDTPSQVGLAAAERHANMAGAFQAAVGWQGKRVILVDDVCTSGATLLACAEAIQSAGGQAVAALTFTRALAGGAL
jgi:ComF family protein